MVYQSQKLLYSSRANILHVRTCFVVLMPSPVEKLVEVTLVETKINRRVALDSLHLKVRHKQDLTIRDTWRNFLPIRRWDRYRNRSKSENVVMEQQRGRSSSRSRSNKVHLIQLRKKHKPNPSHTNTGSKERGKNPTQRRST
ncbi:hypothetical protein G7K_5856-t1 [Saitoella complicata NRRL Y-17804]|uniref:Uncharacterized protein n=1 Tax=Saitoella complicata (strain BCRC 22490 / CBS 7301 / JCM 7358 / NBRC 10748 / NRRL Y-17804) TaxID=698492 RepID=A0A0E9NPN1_SAICN|nr:hypothetical protein G7K_5856-t1 [Saitoella complicata NRRL Y-17804]